MTSNAGRRAEKGAGTGPSSSRSGDGGEHPPPGLGGGEEPEVVVDDGVTSFKCTHCGRLFNKKANCKIHMRKHTGVMPYQCRHPGCGKKFMWKSSFTFHETNSHRGEVETQEQPMPRQLQALVAQQTLQAIRRQNARQSPVLVGRSQDGTQGSRLDVGKHRRETDGQTDVMVKRGRMSDSPPPREPVPTSDVSEQQLARPSPGSHAAERSLNARAASSSTEDFESSSFAAPPAAFAGAELMSVWTPDSTMSTPQVVHTAERGLPLPLGYGAGSGQHRLSSQAAHPSRRGLPPLPAQLRPSDLSRGAAGGLHGQLAGPSIDIELNLEPREEASHSNDLLVGQLPSARADMFNDLLDKSAGERLFSWTGLSPKPSGLFPSSFSFSPSAMSVLNPLSPLRSPLITPKFPDGASYGASFGAHINPLSPDTVRPTQQPLQPLQPRSADVEPSTAQPAPHSSTPSKGGQT
mmetsp:Transcript_6346/g.19180  ORF Transcript_6346/g.19180 Transcript_6346/m.19180 type:complete len:464 (-) Transcript_6346:165-1556(-)